MQAIITKFHGPTDHKGARISARCEAGSVTVSYSYGASGSDGAHDCAAQALLDKLGWHQSGAIWIRGHLPFGQCVYTCVLSTSTVGDDDSRTDLSVSNHALLNPRHTA